MEFKDGSSIITLDEKEAGTLQRVVIDPETKKITHIVILKGLLFKEDKVVPVEKVARATEDKVFLTCTLEELNQLQPLLVKKFMPRNEGEFFERSSGGMYTPPPSESLMVSSTTRTIPEDLLVMREGARVFSADDKHVGNIERVFTNTGKVTHFTLSQGLLSKTEKSIPFDWVKVVSDDEVDLTVEAQVIEKLPIVQK